MINRSLATVLWEVGDDGVAVITLNRPNSANSRNQAMRSELLELYAEAEQDDAIKVVVLTAAGDRFFCAGMDLKEANSPETSEERRARLSSARDIEALARLPKPTIAAINGYALGGGCEMALACDLRWMADEARIGLTEVKLGLIPGGGGTLRLPRAVGAAKAFEMLYRAQLLDGPTAERIGLVNESVPREQLSSAVRAVAAEIAQMPAAALRRAKEVVLAGQQLPVEVAVDRELDGLLDLLEARNSRL